MDAHSILFCRSHISRQPIVSHVCVRSSNLLLTYRQSRVCRLFSASRPVCGLLWVIIRHIKDLSLLDQFNTSSKRVQNPPCQGLECSQRFSSLGKPQTRLRDSVLNNPVIQLSAVCTNEK